MNTNNILFFFQAVLAILLTSYNILFQVKIIAIILLLIIIITYSFLKGAGYRYCAKVDVTF